VPVAIAPLPPVEVALESPALPFAVMVNALLTNVPPVGVVAAVYDEVAEE
jgi:hypothetical protein